MQIKLGEVRNLLEGLREVLEKELPAKPAYWLGKALTLVLAEARAFDEARLRLIDRYAERDEQGKPRVDPESGQYVLADLDGFTTEFLELAQEEVELPIRPIPLESLGEILLKPATMSRLDRVIEV